MARDTEPAARGRARRHAVEEPEPERDRNPGRSEERPGYGRGEWGSEQQGGWRGPGEGPGYREAQGRQQTFQQSSAGGQIPGEFRYWRSGQRPELSESQRYDDRLGRVPHPRRGEPGSRDLAGFRGPDADRDAAGHRSYIEHGERGPHAGRGPKNYRRSDDRIREELCDRLMAHPEIDASDIEVEVKEAHVVLRGSVPDRRTKHRAEDVADHVLGALEIDNQLRVRRGEDRPRAQN